MPGAGPHGYGFTEVAFMPETGVASLPAANGDFSTATLLLAAFEGVEKIIITHA